MERKRIPTFDNFLFESYTLKQICKIQSEGPIKQSCDIVFNSNSDDTFELIQVKIKDIKEPKGFTLSFYKRKGLNEDIEIVKRIIRAYNNNEKIPPIIIDDDMTILDGLHRYVAAKEYFENDAKIDVFKKNKKINKYHKMNETIATHIISFKKLNKNFGDDIEKIIKNIELKFNIDRNSALEAIKSFSQHLMFETNDNEDYLNERAFPLSDASFVKKELEKHKEELIGNKDFGNYEIEQKLNNIFKKYNIKFLSKSGNPEFTDSATVGISGGGITDDGLITIHYNDYFYETFKDDELWNDFVSVLYRIIIHEKIHQYQLNQMRKGRSRSDYYDLLSKVQANTSNRYKYLSNKQEIMAFAVEAVEEFRLLNYTDKEIIQKIKRPFADNNETNIFYLYTDYFDYRPKFYDKDEKKKMKDVLDKFLKYMYQYLTKDSIKL